MPDSFLNLPKPDGEDLAAIFNGLPIGVGCATLEAEQRMLFINESFTRLFGYTLEDIPTVADWARLAYPDEAYRQETFCIWDAAVEKAMRTKGQVEQMEFQVACKNGARKDVLFSATVLEDRLLVSLVDITARRLAEAEARSAQDQLERTAYEVTENIPAGTYTMVLPPDGGMAKFSFMSSRFLELCGLERKAAEENPFNAFACVHPDDREEWIRKNAECFEKKIPFSEECRVIAHGRERWIHAESIPRQRPDGTMVWEGVLSDISQRKLAEKKLAESEESLRQTNQRMRLAADAAGLGFWSRNLETHIEDWDDQMLHIFGCRREDFEGYWEPFVHPDDLARVQEETRVALANGGSGCYEYRIVRPSGEVRHLRGISKLIIDEWGRDLREIGVNFDITAQKQAEEELAQAREKERQGEEQHRLELENKLKTSLTAAAVAHEINQPLSRVLLTAQLALQEAGELALRTPRLFPFLQELAAEANRVVVTINKMKSLLRNVETVHAPLDLVDVVEDALLYGRPLLKDRGVNISFLPPEGDCRVDGDAGQLQIAVGNLLRNAAEAIDHAPASGRRDILVEIRPRPDALEIAIGDSGPGLDETQTAKLLLKSTKADGSGLGLYIVHTTMENHKGHLEVGRSPLGGAEFRMVFGR